MAGPAPRSWPSRWMRFSLRSGLLLFILLSVGLGLVARWIQDVRARGDLQLRLAVTGFEAQIDGFSRPTATAWHAKELETSAWTDLVRHYVHPEYRRQFSRLDVSSDWLEQDPSVDLTQVYGADSVYTGSPKSLRALLMLFGINGVKDLWIGNIQLPNENQLDFRPVQRATELRSISLGNAIPAAFAEELSRLPKLQQISIRSASPEVCCTLCRTENLTELTIGAKESLWDASKRREPMAPRVFIKKALDELAKRTKLSTLKIHGPFPLEPADLRNFCEKSGLSELHLQGTNSAPECLKEFAKLRNLKTLVIDESTVREEHYDWLSTSKSLTSIKIRAPDSSSSHAILELREKMPNCEIWRN